MLKGDIAMQSMRENNGSTPIMTGFTKQMRNTVQRFAAIFLAFALLGALWSTGLARLSDRPTATALLTRAGTDLINPILIANGSGMAQDFYQQLQAAAVAHPSQPLTIGFLKVPILGREIAGKNFADGTRVIYADVANIYYRQGPSGAFVLPAALQSVVSNYTPFVQPPQAISSSLPNIPIPQIPAFVSQLTVAAGVTPATLTADGHAGSLTRALWLWIISAVLALVLILLNTGWDRLWSVAWPLFHAAWPITLVGIVATVLVHSKPQQAAPYMGVLGLIGNTFMLVFYAAFGVGVLSIVVSLVGNRLTSAQTAKPATTASQTAAGYLPVGMPPPTQARDDRPTPTYKPYEPYGTTADEGTPPPWPVQDPRDAPPNA